MQQSPWNVPELLKRQREFYSKDLTRALTFRLEALRRLKDALESREYEIFQSLKSDLRKHEFEAYVGELGMIYEELNLTIKRLPKWMAPRSMPTPLSLWPSRSKLFAEPLGTVLIIAPWNYPINLAFIPLIGAIAAGNTAIVKTSELAPQSSKFMRTLIQDIFDPSYIAVVEGGIPETQELLTQKFDHIFFTGSTQVGKVVMRAAAEHLTPVTLELGGKSPCIIDSSCNIDVAAKRIAWGKFFNAGQTCTAPDYILCESEIKQSLIERLRHHIRNFYGHDPAHSPDYARIINQKHVSRLSTLMSEGKIVVGGQINASELYIAPTVIDQVQSDSKIMEEEIFGPLLPILEVKDVFSAFDFVRERPKPLAAYLFSNQSSIKRRFTLELSFGGGCINNVLLHFANPHLPFGGVGDSGMGAYHGQRTFEVFTHRKPVLKTPFSFEIPLHFPAYKEKLAIARRFIG